MTQLPRVLHLVDDTTAGGVMRVLDFICSDPVMAQTAQHEVKPVTRGKMIGKLRDADVVVSHLTVSWRSLPAMAALKASHPRTPLLHVEHSYTENFVLHNVNRQQRFKRLLRTAYALFDRVICVSNGQAEWLKKARLVRSNAIVVIQSCVNLDDFRAIPARRGPVRVFGAIGRLDAQKGFDTLIRAFRKCEDLDIELHIVGTGAQEQELRALAKGDDRIVFRGFQSDTAAALAKIDVVVMPSRWEAYGLVAIEALASGRRLLCSDIDGLQDHAALGGRVVPIGEVSDLTDQIIVEAGNEASTNEPWASLDACHSENNFREKWDELLGELSMTA